LVPVVIEESQKRFIAAVLLFRKTPLSIDSGLFLAVGERTQTGMFVLPKAWLSMGCGAALFQLECQGLQGFVVRPDKNYSNSVHGFWCCYSWLAMRNFERGG
jgi:hypothetical protein